MFSCQRGFSVLYFLRGYMAEISKKYPDKKYPAAVPAQPGRCRKLPAWQSELLTSLESRPEVRFRRVKPDELVVPGDYIKDSEHSYRPWDGPRGFRAASFRSPVYRPEPKAQSGAQLQRLKA